MLFGTSDGLASSCKTNSFWFIYLSEEIRRPSYKQKKPMPPPPCVCAISWKNMTPPFFVVISLFVYRCTMLDHWTTPLSSPLSSSPLLTFLPYMIPSLLACVYLLYLFINCWLWKTISLVLLLLLRSKTELNASYAK